MTRPPPLDAAAWAELEPWMDQALDLDEAARAAWLAQQERVDPFRVACLRRLLDGAARVEASGQLAPPITPAPEATPSQGDRVGPWRLLRELGSGGMGEVWLAERADGVIERRAAIKRLRSALRRSVLAERFERERHILAKLQHPHIAHLLDAGFDHEGHPYLALEFVSGANLMQHVERAQSSLDARLRLLLQVCDAVAYAHTRLVVHRDLKPGNILVTDDGEVRLLDFGIAKLLDESRGEADATELTRAGARALTPEYAAPEQFDGGTIGTATDVYALGVLLFELACGSRPRDRVADPFRDPLPRPTSLRGAKAATGATLLARRAAADLDTIALKALKVDPRERYPTVEAFAADLHAWLDHRPISARPDTLGYRSRLFVRRHRGAVLGASLFVLALAAALAVALWQATEAHRQAIEAREQVQRRVAQNDVYVRFVRQVLSRGTREQALSQVAELERIADALPTLAPRRRAEIASVIGAHYRALAAYVDADRVLAQAEHALDPGDVEYRVWLACERSGSVLPQRSPEQRRDSAAALLARIERERLPDWTGVRCLQALSTAERDRGDLAAAIAATERQLAWQIRAEGEDAADTVAVRNELVNLLLSARQLDRAQAELTPALRGLEAARMQGSMTAASLHANAALLARNRGDLRGADDHFRLALDAIEERGIRDARFVTVAMNHAATLALLDRREAARERFAQALDVAREVAPDRRGPYLLLAARWHQTWREPERVRALLDEFDAMVARAAPSDPSLRLRADLLRALASLEARPPHDATALEQTIVRLREAGPRVALHRARALRELAAYRLDAGRADDAARALDEARAETVELPFEERAETDLLAARIALRVGRQDEAAAVAARAERGFCDALGETHPACREARSLVVQAGVSNREHVRSSEPSGH